MCPCATVEQTGKNTFFGRTATLLQNVENLGNLQRILMRVVIVLLVRPSAQFYTPYTPLAFRSSLGMKSSSQWPHGKCHL